MKKINSVYVVDDDETYQFIVRSTIEETSLVGRVESFSNGYEAFRFLESVATNDEELPEMILLDVSMPVLDGWGFLENYQALKPRLKKVVTIFVVSSSINPMDLEKAKSIDEVKDYLVKPISRDTFINLVNEVKL